MKGKKIFGLAVLGCSALLLTGCGGKKLTCTIEEEQDGIGVMNAKTVFEYDKEGKILENVSAEFVIKYEDQITDDQKEIYEGMFGEACEVEDAPKDCKVKSTDDKFEFKATGTAEELGYSEKSSYDEIKKDLEKSGYTCK